MKKTISLLLQLILILTVCTNTFTVCAAPDGTTPLAKVLTEISGDDVNVTTNTSTSKKIGDKIIIFGPSTNSKGESNIFSDDAYFGEKAVIVNQSSTGSSEGNDMRFQLSMGGLDSGKITFAYNLYIATDNSCRMNLRLRSGSSYLKTVNLMELGLNPYEWYNMKICLDFESTEDNCTIEAIKPDGSVFAQNIFTCNFTGKALDYVFIWGTPKSDTLPEGAPDSIKNELAFYAMNDFLAFHDDGTDKAKILSVGSDGEVAYNQKEVCFKLSENINGLTKDHIIVKNDSGQDIKASSISVTSDAGTCIVNAVMESNLAPWSLYTLEISPACYSAYKEVSDGKLQNVSAIKKDFHTPAAPFDIKEPVFTSDDGKISVSAMLINTSSSAEDVTFVFSVFSDGRQESISSITYPDFTAEYPGEELSHSTDITNGQKAQFFVINGWSNPSPLFGKLWKLNDSADVLPSVTKPEADSRSDFIIGEFDYENKKINVSFAGDVNSTTNGTLLVYKKGDILSDTVLPVYAEYVITSTNGSFKTDILFNKNLSHGEYIVEFCPENTQDVHRCEFAYYTDEQLLDISKENIFTNAKSATTSGVLMQVIKGTDSNEEKINNNFEIFSADANMTKYNKLKDKDAVFALMFKKMSDASDYDGLVSVFENAADELYKKENTSASSPSSNNKNYGSSSVAVKESYVKTEAKPETKPESPKPDDEIKEENPPVNTSGTELVFPDMKGHWAQKSVSDLCKKGIMNCYNDGSFRGDDKITRAEISKILVLAFANEAAYNNEFTDVSSNDWYADYIAGAKQHGIINGYEDGSFSPQSHISRQDAALMLYRAMKLVKEIPAGYRLFTDDLEISYYAEDATRALGEIGIINGNPDGTFRPLDTITRAEVATIVCRAFDYIQSH